MFDNPQPTAGLEHCEHLGECGGGLVETGEAQIVDVAEGQHHIGGAGGHVRPCLGCRKGCELGCPVQLWIGGLAGAHRIEAALQIARSDIATAAIGCERSKDFGVPAATWEQLDDGFIGLHAKEVECFRRVAPDVPGSVRFGAGGGGDSGGDRAVGSMGCSVVAGVGRVIGVACMAAAMMIGERRGCGGQCGDCSCEDQSLGHISLHRFGGETALPSSGERNECKRVWAWLRQVQRH